MASLVIYAMVWWLQAQGISRITRFGHSYSARPINDQFYSDTAVLGVITCKSFFPDNPF